MKLVIQRVTSASVSVEQNTVAQIKQGMLVLVGFGQKDEHTVLPKAAEKMLNLRIFSDADGRFQYSALDQKMDVLLVPQFTLYGNTNSGRRPDFVNAMHPKQALTMFSEFCKLVDTYPLGETGAGVFGADMQVALVNDGPVTLTIEI